MNTLNHINLDYCTCQTTFFLSDKFFLSEWFPSVSSQKYVINQIGLDLAEIVNPDAGALREWMSPWGDGGRVQCVYRLCCDINGSLLWTYSKLMYYYPCIFVTYCPHRWYKCLPWMSTVKVFLRVNGQHHLQVFFT